MKLKTCHLLPMPLVLFAMTMPLHAVSFYWDGTDTTADADGGSGTWNSGITANWDSTPTGGTDVTWTNGSNTAVFGGTSGTVSVDAGGVGVNGLTFDTADYVVQDETITFNATGAITANANATISSAFAVAGNQAVNTAGTGTLTLSGTANLYEFYSRSAVKITGTFNTSGKFIVQSNSTLDWSGTGNVGGSTNYVGIADGSNGTLNVTGGSFTATPKITSPATALFIGNGTGVTGSVNVSGGSFIVPVNTAIYIGAGYNGAGSGTAAGTGSVTVSGTGLFTTGVTTGDLRLGAQSGGSATVNLESGGTFATSRTFKKGTSGTATSTAAINFNGGTLQATAANSDWIWNTITVNVQAGGARIDSNGFNMQIKQAMLNGGGTDGGLVKNGAGELYLNGNANTFNGGVTVNNGLFLINDDRGFGAVPENFSASNITLNGGGIKNYSTSLTIHPNRGIYLGSNGGSILVWDGRTLGIPGEISGPGNLIKADLGTLILNASNTYTGSTSVNAGVLLVNGSLTSAVTVNSSATLGGMGSITGQITVNTGGALAPGNGIGTFYSANTVIAGALSIEIDGAFSDLLQVDGSLDLTGSTLSVSALSTPTEESYVIANYSTTLTGEFASVTGTPPGYSVQYDTANKQILLVRHDGFASWAAQNGLSGNPSDDFDGDGLPDSVEYVLGSQPTARDGGVPTLSTTGGQFVFSFQRAHTSMTSDISVSVEVGTNLADWPGVYHVGADTASSDAGIVVTNQGDHDTVTLTLPQATDAKKFARLRVDVTP